MEKTQKLQMELPKEGRFISSEFPILRENLGKIDQAIAHIEEKANEKAPLQHTHTISDINGLETVLKSKMSADKTFTFADLSDIEGVNDAANNYVLYKASNNHFTFGSAISLLGKHQHKTDDIVGLENFLMTLFNKKPVEILMTESGAIPFPEGVNDDTEVEIWAWGGGGGGGGDGGSDKNGGGGGGGGQHARVKIKVSDLKKSQTVQIGRGGKGGRGNGSWGGNTFIEGIILAGGGGYGGGNDNTPDGYAYAHGNRGNGGRGGDGGVGGGTWKNNKKDDPQNESVTFSGGNGGYGGGYKDDDNGVHGGNSIYGGGGGGGGGKKNGTNGYGGNNGGGNGGKYGANGGGGGGGYFRGKNGGKLGGDGGNGAILLRFFL
ncbi:Bgr_08870 family protein [Bartonella raoultii]|uniref:Glycine-rich domain-containing protein n=1 Tax=Bartonella raoultii TaxID=1457020 RepID=A0ABS7I686_9HYPH|nr:Bgr_08870 family protein [Bartonella raoultii]MBX4336408.1 hypothetical protein [Bartonella raoultii]